MNLLFVVLFALFAKSLSKELPDFLTVCKRNDPNLQTCIKNTIISLKPNLAKGIPEFQVPSVEPLKLKESLNLKPTDSLIVSVVNLKLHGLSDFQLPHFHYDVNTNKINFTAIFKNVYNTGKYVTEGRLFFIPVTGSGKFLTNFTNVVGKCEFDAEIVDRNGENYVNVKKLSVKLNIPEGVITLVDLFGIESVLGDIINRAINDNFDLMMVDFLPPVERIFSAYLLNLTNKIFTSYTYDQLFPL